MNMNFKSIGWLALALAILPSKKLPGDEVLFSFDQPNAGKPWQTVNDGVMGGRSVGRLIINAQGHMEFFGTLSLANNGGFASVRTRISVIDLQNNDVFVARVRGDGRRYSFNLYDRGDLGGYSYRQSFQTENGKWIEVELPIDKSVATWRGRDFPNQKLDPRKVSGLGFLLGDKTPGPFKLEVDWLKVRRPSDTQAAIPCDGSYPHHLQGICSDEDAISWSFTTALVKTDRHGKLIKQVPVANHHGDLCFDNGKVFVAVNHGKFNDAQGNADSWVYIYDAETLDELSRHEVQEVFHGAGGIAVRNDHFFVVGGLPDGVDENYVYEYDSRFKFVERHVIRSGHTHLGIQTVTFAHDRWWFGCYGDPRILLVTDANFQMNGRYELDCSLGIEGAAAGRLLVGRGVCRKGEGCTGNVQVALPDDQNGFRLLHDSP
ncbi:MAG: CIA30 family protein [Planctomycetota bacterium]